MSTATSTNDQPAHHQDLSQSRNTVPNAPNPVDVRSLSSTSSGTELPISHDTVPEKTTVGQDDCSRPEILQRTTTSASKAEPIYSVFTRGQKRFIVFIASWAGFFSPVSATIYLPALNALAADLKVSNSLINLTLTSYMIFQGIAPSLIGNLADTTGRRPAYLICFAIYISANIGLATQNSYPALFVLRCLQSSGSSATVAMASAVVSDISTPAERGKYIGFMTAGALLAPAIGPTIGGVLTQFLSWRAIFWFLVIFSGAFLTIFIAFFPETGRSIVGNGSVPPRGMNMSLLNYHAVRKARKAAANSNEVSCSPDESTIVERSKKGFPNPLASFKILFDRSNALLLFYNGFLFAAFYDVTASIPSQFAAIYKFNDLQIGLCYIPFGAGSLCSALLNGQLLDKQFRRWCRKLNVVVKRGRDQDLSNFPIERVRLEMALPAVYMATMFLLVFGWVLNYHVHVAVTLVILFFISFSTGIAFNVTSTLLIDFYPRRAGTATAANNLVRCLLGAGATGLIVPMIDAMGLGWTYTFLSLFLITTSPMLWLLMWRGMDWRKVRTAREEERNRKKQDAMAGKVEEGAAGMDITNEKPTSPPEEGIVVGETVEVLSEKTEQRKTK